MGFSSTGSKLKANRGFAALASYIESLLAHLWLTSGHEMTIS
jgi:hypothetical protein